MDARPQLGRIALTIRNVMDDEAPGEMRVRDKRTLILPRRGPVTFCLRSFYQPEPVIQRHGL